MLTGAIVGLIVGVIADMGDHVLVQRCQKAMFTCAGSWIATGVLTILGMTTGYLLSK